MSRQRPRISDLTPEELELLALEHIESMFIELRATSAVVRERYHPVKLIKQHPFLAAGLAAAAGFILARHLRRKSAACCGEKKATPGLFDSLLSGVAGSVLPDVLASWLEQRSKPD